MDIYNLLEKLNINYKEISHKKVFTSEEAIEEHISQKLGGIECKNLFVKNSKNYFLIFAKVTRTIDLKELAKSLNESRFSFANEDELYSLLKLSKGSVTPLGIINDVDNKVTLLLDKDLNINDKILVHPNANTKTMCILFKDLLRVIEYTSHKYHNFISVKKFRKIIR